MAQLYADEDFSYPVVEELRRLGHDVLTAQEAGHAGQAIEDRDVLAFAVSRGRAVVTFNRRHFINLHRQVKSHRGIIVCTRESDIAGLAARIHQEVTNCPTLENQLLRVVRPQTA